MTKADKIKIAKLIHHLGLKYNLSDIEIKQIVNSPYLFTKKKFKEINFDEVKTEDDFKEIKSKFLYRGLGLLYPTYTLCKQKNKNRETINKINNKWKN